MEPRPEDWRQAPGLRLDKLLLPVTKVVFGWVKRLALRRWRRRA